MGHALKGLVMGHLVVRTGSCLHKQSAWSGVLEGVYPPGASTTSGSNYANKVEGGIYFQRQSGFRAIYHMRGAWQMRLSNTYCARLKTTD